MTFESGTNKSKEYHTIKLQHMWIMLTKQMNMKLKWTTNKPTR